MVRRKSLIKGLLRGFGVGGAWSDGGGVAISADGGFHFRALQCSLTAEV